MTKKNVETDSGSNVNTEITLIFPSESIATNNVSSFLLTGVCQEGTSFALTSPLQHNLSCSSGSYSVSLDLSSISDGTVIFEITKADGSKTTKSITKNTLAIVPNSLMTLLSGESYSFLAAGGVPPYLFSDAGSGYMSSTTGIYTCAINANPQTETVSVADALGRSVETTVNIRAFETKDQFNLDSTKSASATSILELSSGVLLAGGIAYDSSNISHWIVRKSSDSGQTWSTVDNYVHESLGVSLQAMAKDSMGNVYAVGNGEDLIDYEYSWLVRKSSNAGVSWVTVDTFKLVPTLPSKAYNLVVTPQDTLLVVGYGKSGGSERWHVRRSTNSGGSWTTVDNFLPGGWTDSGTRHIILATDGSILVGGNIINSGLASWVVRRSSDDGLTWNTVDQYNLVADQRADLLFFQSDSIGNVLAMGKAVDGSLTQHTILRRSTDNGLTWSTLSTDPPSLSLVNVPLTRNTITRDNLGNFYFGMQVTEGPSQYWTIYKSSDLGLTWTAVDKILTLRNIGRPRDIRPCLGDRLCVAGDGDFNPASYVDFQIRILSP